MYLATVKLGPVYMLSGTRGFAWNLGRANPTTPLSLALRFSAFTMREIGLVIAPLDPRHKSEALFNRLCMQGQHDLEEPAQLRHRECWRFFPPDALSSAREKNGPAS